MVRRTRSHPFADFVYLFDQMDRMSQEMLGRSARTQVWTLPVDVFDRGDELIVQAFVPGIRAEHLDVEIDDGVLTISGSFPELYDVDDAEAWIWYSRELRSGNFRRSINLPFKVDLSTVQAEVEDGFLRLALPKAPEAKPYRISITGGESMAPELSEVETEN